MRDKPSHTYCDSNRICPVSQYRDFSDTERHFAFARLFISISILRQGIHRISADARQDRQIRNRSLGRSSHRPIRSHHRIGIQGISSPLRSPPYVTATRAAIHSENIFIQKFSYRVSSGCTCSSTDQHAKESSYGRSKTGIDETANDSSCFRSGCCRGVTASSGSQ